MDCQIKNSLVVGTITSVTGTIVMILVNKEKKINIKTFNNIFCSWYVSSCYIRIF